MRIRLPALTFSKDSRLWPVRDASSLTQASERRIRRGDFDGMTLVDAEAHLLVVTGLKRMGYAPPFLGFRLFTSRMKQIELQVQDEGELDIQQIRDRAWRGIEKQRTFWEAAWDMDDLERELRACGSVAAIVDLLLAHSGRGA